MKKYVAGHLTEKKGYYYCVLSYKDETGNRKNKWISTGLPVKGNKKKAEEKLLELRSSFTLPLCSNKDDALFSEYILKQWLPAVKNTLEETTYSSYLSIAKTRICPYFRETALKDLKAKQIQDFYTFHSNRVKPATVKKYHAVIHAALEWAVKLDIIKFNPSDRVSLPKSIKYVADFYTADEIIRLFRCVRGDEMEILIQMACFFGLRRSEILGLKWSAINFEDPSFVIKHTVTKTMINGHKAIIKKDRVKQNASYRTMPLFGFFCNELKNYKRQQEVNRDICGNSYFNGDAEYVFVDQMGFLFDPDRVSRHFKTVLRKNNLREIRFHDTRHSSASLLISLGENMKAVQEWLGHSDYSTTANFYSHLEKGSKRHSAESMNNRLELDNLNNFGLYEDDEV